MSDADAAVRRSTMNTDTIIQNPAADAPARPPVVVEDVMHRGVVFCGQAATPGEIARLMVSCKVHCVAVMGHAKNARPDPTIWGIVSDVDLLAAMVRPSAPKTAADLARHEVISIRSSKPVEEAALAMVTYDAQHLVVIDADSQGPVGFLSALDLVKVVAGDD